MKLDAHSHGISTDRALRLIGDRRRRTALQYLIANGDTAVEIDRLAADIARKEATGTPRDEFAIELHHHHLPKLSEAGLLEYDAERYRVTYRGDEAIENLVRVVSETAA